MAMQIHWQLKMSKCLWKLLRSPRKETIFNFTELAAFSRLFRFLFPSIYYFPFFVFDKATSRNYNEWKQKRKENSCQHGKPKLKTSE